MKLPILLASFALLLGCAGLAAGATPLKTQNVILIAIDGVRWHEVFKGADAQFLVEKSKVVRDVPRTRDLSWRETPEARRSALMPFLWSTIATKGQIFGDRSRNCLANVENRGHASEEGYSELLRGFDDPTRYGPHADNPVNVLEFLNQREPFKNHVAVFVVWAPLLEIAEVKRGNLYGFGGWQPIPPPLSEKDRIINELTPQLPRIWPEANFDFVIMHAAMRHLQQAHPRAMFIALNEADEWAHLKRYDLYLEAIQKSDRFIQQLWEKLQSMPQYAGKTSLVIVTDHGRGDSEIEWINHRSAAAGTGDVWYAVLGPDTPALGVRENLRVTSSQIAATVAALLGLDFRAGDERRRPALPDVVSAN